MQKVLLAGATGYLGACLLTEFRRRGIYVRALVRRPDQAATLRSRANEVFTGQITVPSTLRGAAMEVDTVFSTVGITRQRDGLTCEEVDFQGNVNLLEEALRSGCGRFGYVSLLHGPALRHLRLADAKERFVDRLRAS
ncbi:MAG TPA: NAD(P)H-binding protein, partial [Bryobacteraceae bacterium]|nr:NAD(P)H-binding protein [Bryobacteraceae bacterium]